jgi:hypothetical protein
VIKTPPDPMAPSATIRPDSRSNIAQWIAACRLDPRRRRMRRRNPQGPTMFFSARRYRRAAPEPGSRSRSTAGERNAEVRRGTAVRRVSAYARNWRLWICQGICHRSARPGVILAHEPLKRHILLGRSPEAPCRCRTTLRVARSDFSCTTSAAGRRATWWCCSLY